MIKLISIEHESPELIELQYRSFKKNLLEDFEFILIDNAQIANNTRVSNQFAKLAERIPITHIQVEIDLDLVNEFDSAEDSKARGFSVFSGDRYSTGTIANAYALQWTQKHVISNQSDPTCLMHSDIFMVRPDTLSSYLKELDLAYYSHHVEEGVSYAWPFFFMMGSGVQNRESLKWWCGSINGIPVDCGGMSYYFLTENDHLKKRHLSLSYVQDDPSLDFHPSDYEIFSILPDSTKSMIHYRSASNWNNRSSDYHQSKMNWIKNLIGA
jgi:hypothetical protein